MGMVNKVNAYGFTLMLDIVIPENADITEYLDNVTEIGIGIIRDIIKSLSYVDWTYEYSDDIVAYHTGNRQQKLLKFLMFKVPDFGNIVLGYKLTWGETKDPNFPIPRIGDVSYITKAQYDAFIEAFTVNLTGLFKAHLPTCWDRYLPIFMEYYKEHNYTKSYYEKGMALCEQFGRGDSQLVIDTMVRMVELSKEIRVATMNWHPSPKKQFVELLNLAMPASLQKKVIELRSLIVKFNIGGNREIMNHLLLDFIDLDESVIQIGRHTSKTPTISTYVNEQKWYSWRYSKVAMGFPVN